MKNPHDGNFKSLAEEFPELLLRLLGIVASGMKLPIVTILRELRLDPVQIDHAYKVGEDEDAFIAHLEAISRWRADRIRVLSLYNFLLKHRERIQVFSYLIPMAERWAPEELPKMLVWADADGQRIETPYRTIKLWEIDSAIAFEPDCKPLLEWVPLLKGGLETMERAADAIEDLMSRPQEAPYPPATMAHNLATMASLRYDKDVLRDFLERIRKKMLMSEEVWKDSWIWQEAEGEGRSRGEAIGREQGEAAGREQGEAAGRQQGEVTGREQGKRSLIRLALEKKFAAESFPELDRIHQPEALDRIFVSILDAQTPGQARAAIAEVLRGR